VPRPMGTRRVAGGRRGVSGGRRAGCGVAWAVSGAWCRERVEFDLMRNAVGCLYGPTPAPLLTPTERAVCDGHERERLRTHSFFASSTRRHAVALAFPSGRAADSLDVASRPRREVREPPHAGKALPVRRDGIDSGAPEPSSGSLRERTGKHDGPSPQPPPNHSNPGRSFMPTPPLSHADALARLREGNERFSNG